MKLRGLFVCLFMYCTFAFALLVTQNTIETIPHLLDVSVTVNYDNSYGSGVIFRAGDKNYILTCSHTLTSARKVKNGRVSFDDVLVYQEIYDKYTNVGRKYYYAKIVRYSPTEIEDVAILELTNTSLIAKPVKVGIEPLSLGSTVIGVGSPLGPKCPNSMMLGNYAAYGRILDGSKFDQVSLASGHGGVSGGGCFGLDGSYLGMFARKAESGILYIIPSRRIKDYLDRVGFSFLFTGECISPEIGNQHIEEK